MFNDWTIFSLLNRPRGQRIANFVPGIALQKMSEVVTDGVIWGIDHSEVMFKQASKRNRKALLEGRVKLVLGPVSSVSSLVGQVDEVLDVNSFQFWTSPVDDLKKLRTQLAPGGMIALMHQPRKPGSTEDEADGTGRRFADYLKRAGFRDISIEKRVMKPVSTVCVLARC